MLAVQWTRGDNERYWGPFTWSPEQSSSGWGLHIKSVGSVSGDTGEGGPSYLRIGLGKRSLLVRTPRWLIPPVRSKYHLTSLPPDQLEAFKARNGGRDWVWQTYPREYGFMFNDSLHLQFGVQNLSWGGPGGSESKVWFYPWTCRRTVRQSFYDGQGKHFAEGIVNWNHESWNERRVIEDSVPVRTFAFKDYDGEIITATLRLEERESAMGEGRWKWLSRFFKNQVYRSFDIKFSSEVGTEKGSWKGGTVGHSIRAASPVELHADAFRRYCDERNAEVAKRDGRDSKRASRMTFLHEVK